MLRRSLLSLPAAAAGAYILPASAQALLILPSRSFTSPRKVAFSNAMAWM